jgi:DNA repair exonuclease SbcCD nuclease subunit
MSDEIKVLIMSDMHLGSAADGTPARENARINTFRKITSLAQEHDLLLVAGDLVDSGTVSESLKSLIAGEFEAVRERGAEILLSPGFGELKDDGGLHEFISGLGATHVFGAPGSSPVYSTRRGEQDISVYGAMASGDFDMTAVKRNGGRGFHMGLFHSDFDFQSNKAGIRLLELDFYAMGCSHTFRMFKVHDRIIGAYPGSPEAVSSDETGDRYIISMLIKGNEIFHIKRLSVNSMRFRTLEADCSEMAGFDALRDMLLSGASQREILTLKLKGRRDFPLDGDFERLSRHFFDMKIHDASVPTLRSLAQTYQKEDTIRGEFYRLLQEYIASGETGGDGGDELLPEALNILTRDGFQALEDWLCDM